MKPTIVLAIPHTPWRPERVESKRRLSEALSIDDSKEPSPFYDVKVFDERAANHVWSVRMWEWGASYAEATHFLTLQDDVLPAPNFWRALHAMLQAVPDQVIGLEAAHPAGPELARDGHRWYTTSDYLVGVQYVMPTPLLREFLVWRSSALAAGAVENISEDTLVGLWCLATGRRIWHPIPAIADHDVELASTYGNDDHANRRPSVLQSDVPALVGGWIAEDPSFWYPADDVPHLGRMYPSSPGLLRTALRESTEADYLRWLHDDGADVLAGLRHRMLGRAYTAPKARLFVCTPYRGGLHPEHVASVTRLQSVVGLDVRHELELQVRQEHEDLVRVRSRMVREFLASNCTHLLFVDADIAFSPAAVFGMLSARREFVQTPYRRRDGKGYSLRPTPKIRAQGGIAPDDIDGQLVAIEGTGLGLTLLSRACLERMVAFWSELKFLDGGSQTIALFQLLLRDGGLMSEDMSFAARWRDTGGTVWLYVGDGSPATHYGQHAFEGSVEDLGLARAPKGAA